MISELEDERRWARLREGIWLAVLIHILLLSAITWIPSYIFNVTPVIDPFDAIKQRKDLTYLDLPPDLIKKLQPKVQVKPVPEQQPHVDKKTLEALNKPTPPPPRPSRSRPRPPDATGADAVRFPKSNRRRSRPRLRGRRRFRRGPTLPWARRTPPTSCATPCAGSFADQAQTSNPGAGGGCRCIPARAPAAFRFSPTQQGVDFSSWLLRWHRETERTWDPLIPDEVNPPILKKGAVVIRFKVLPNGRLMDGSMVLEGRSGDTALDRAAWGALTGSNYPPLPQGVPRALSGAARYFLYNMEPGH